MFDTDQALIYSAPASRQKNIYLHTDDLIMPAASVRHSYNTRER